MATEHECKNILKQYFIFDYNKKDNSEADIWLYSFYFKI